MEAIQLIKLALSVVTDRLITILALLTSFGLGCWTMWDPTWERVGTLGIYVIFCYLTINAKEHRNEESSPATGP
jgi:TRAP-type C4-dicarboxylate transport system permease small subunit